jgi:FAD/FMN-containing dehydrogenase
MKAVHKQVSAWGNLGAAKHLAAMPAFRDEVPAALAELIKATGTVLAHGLGRSYGASCLNGGGGLIVTPRLDRCLSMDAATGILRAEAGMSLAALHRLTVPKGWFVPVTPGTKFVTLGGAVANDVHGKNQHVAGSFGRHVRRLGLRRSDGTLIECSPEGESDLLRATIGGLGLTGLIEWVEIALSPITSCDMEVENIRFGHVDAFFDLAESSSGWPYTVAWVDCLSRGAALGRGIFSRGRHSTAGPLRPERGGARPAMPFTPPVGLVNRSTVRLFNEAYWHRPGGSFAGRCHLESFFYPLDAIDHWNRLYGRRGFYQYQCVLPPETARQGIARLLDRIATSGQGSFLAVLKTFGDLPAAGLLSFPMAGTSLALDFPNCGEPTLALLASLDTVVLEAGGRLYPAKDARMPPKMVLAGYPRWGEFQSFIDPGFASDFGRRMRVP